MKTEVLAYCPGCGFSFITLNGNQQYCTKECYDYYYNKLHRNKSSHYLKTLNKNVETLRRLVGDNKQSILSIDELVKAGFDFEIYSEQKPAEFDPLLYYLIYGDFTTNLTTNHQIKIVKTK